MVYGTSKAIGMGLSGFANPALALVAGALFIAAAMTLTGLDRRIALMTLSRVGTSSRHILGGTLVVIVLLSLVVPSATARAACVVPIMLGIITAFGIDKRSNFAAGMMIIVAQGTSIWNIGIQTAAAQNLLLVGFMDKLLGERVSWIDWLIAGAPWAVLMSFVLLFIVLKLLPPETERIAGGKEAVARSLAELGPMTSAQKRLLAVSIGLLLCWATEGKLHSFDTTSTTYAGLVILMLPRIGVMNWKEVQTRVPWGTVIVFGVGISLGTVLLTTQAGQWLGAQVVAHRAWRGGAAGHLRHSWRLSHRDPPGLCQCHGADLGDAADPDFGVAEPAGRLQPAGDDHAARFRRQLRLHPADQRTAEHGLPGHRNLQCPAVRQGRRAGDADRLSEHVAVRGDLVALAGLDLSAAGR